MIDKTNVPATVKTPSIKRDLIDASTDLLPSVTCQPSPGRCLFVRNTVGQHRVFCWSRGDIFRYRLRNHRKKWSGRLAQTCQLQRSVGAQIHFTRPRPRADGMWRAATQPEHSGKSALRGQRNLGRNNLLVRANRLRMPERQWTRVLSVAAVSARVLTGIDLRGAT